MNKNKVEGFIGNESLIKESHKMDDLFDVKEQKQSFEKFLDTLDNSAIAGYLGRFGAGKSTLLHQIKKEREKKQEEVWIDFDAWKFPERKELWDGFVLDFAKQIDKKLFNKVKKQIEGNDNRGKKAIFNTFSDLSGIKFLKNFESFFDKTPATRIFEIQDIINEAIEKLDKDIYIVAEDIDRSGKEGLFFLETLSQFLRDELKSNKKVVVITPISNEIFNQEDSRDSLIKSIDYFFDFEFKVPDFTEFQKKIFRNEFQEDLWMKQLNSFFQSLFQDFETMTPRLLKMILRKAERNYINQKKEGREPDFRITIMIESSKYFKVNRKKGLYFHQSFKKSGLIDANNIFKSFLFAISENKETIKHKNSDGSEIYYSIDKKFKFINNKKPGKEEPWFIGTNPFEKEGAYYLRSFYLNY